MTNKEAIETLPVARLAIMGNPSIVNDEFKRYSEAISIATEALEKADKYRWHDLRKNPEDLPETYRTILVKIDCQQGCVNIAVLISRCSTI